MSGLHDPRRAHRAGTKRRVVVLPASAAHGLAARFLDGDVPPIHRCEPQQQ